MKRCARCRKRKSLRVFHRDPRNISGRGSYCRPCHNRSRRESYYRDVRKSRARRRRWTREHPEQYKASRDRYYRKNRTRLLQERNRRRYLKKYGIAYEQFRAMVKRQCNRCAVCKRPPNGRYRKLQVDHCHTTGKVRALLCVSCNSGLGHMRDDLKTARAAVRYLEKWR